MKILGVGCSFEHDPSAALIIDEKVVAAADEERFSRNKHALNELPIQAIGYCLESAGISPDAIDAVAFPWSYSAYRRLRWRFFRRNFATRTDHALKAIFKSRERRRQKEQKLLDSLLGAGIDPLEVAIHPVEHHLAHASSSFHLCGFDPAALLTVDGKGEFTTTLVGEGRDGRMRIIKEFVNPDSLGLFYSTMTEFLGFEVNSGEFKVMGMAPFGDPDKIDISDLISSNGSDYRINERLVWVPRSRRYQGKKRFPAEIVERWGEPRQGDGLTEPHIHIAAATQRALETAVLATVDGPLAPILKRTDGRLCFAGGCALNVSLNRKLIDHERISSLWVQPAAHDAGTALGAATYVAAEKGIRLEPMGHPYLGPEYSDDAIVRALEKLAIPHRKYDDIVETTADLLAAGHIVAWFQGRMEYGPRALGNRSILGHPGAPGISDEINGRIKFREKWRPFCPSILKEHGAEIIGTEHDSPFMTFAFTVTPEWREKIAEAVHVDNTCRPQLVREELNPRYYRLLRCFQKRTGLPVLLNTSLNRRGEPMVCSPEDAIAMFYGCGLEYLVLGDRLICKNTPDSDPR